MMWGGISHQSRADLVHVPGTLTSVRYWDEIIRPVVVPFIRQGHARIFQQDNARPHTARHTRAVFQQNHIVTLDWPARSPDLSPIEHMWDVLGRRVRKPHDVDNVNDLELALQRGWARIPLGVIRDLIGSMRRRCMAVIAKAGGHNRY